VRMPRQSRIIAILLLLSVAGASLAAAAPTVIKLATLVPDGSVWDKALKRMGSEWKRDTGGRVSLRIYPGGVAGDDPDILRKMRIGQLQAGTLTSGGLSDIDPAFGIFGIPLFYESDEELYYVLDKLEPELIRRLEAKGFEFLHWGHAGWVHLFSVEPLNRVEDLQRQKIFVWAGDDDLVQWWKREGFHPVALAATDILTGLETGMIEVLPTTPLAALALQWFRLTPYMHDLGLAPFIGATIVTKAGWRRISEEDREVLRASASRTEEWLLREIPQQDGVAVEEMRKRGLEVTGGEIPAEWSDAAERFASSSRGERVPADIFDMALAARAEFRQRKAESTP